MMKILISGASGFVGSNLIGILSQEPSIYDITPLDITTGIDLSDINQIDKIKPFDVFVHLANLSYVPDSYGRPEAFYRINYLTTLNALEFCRKYNARLVYISSYVYGPPQYLPVDENHPVCPFNPYAQSKVICESLCEGYERDFGIKTTILRPFNIYGAGQNGKLLIPEIVDQLKKRGKVYLKDPLPRRDYVNVRDVANAIKLCIDNVPSRLEKYNICSGESYSVRELTEMFNNNLPVPVEFEFSVTDRKNEVNETRGSYEKIYAALGWKPNVGLNEGISEIINFEKISQ